MKIKETPEEVQQAKKWWAEQKERVNKEYQEVKKTKIKKRSLVSPEKLRKILS